MTTLKGRTILIVEDEALIAAELASAFGEAGADIVITHQLRFAKDLVEMDHISGVVLDILLQDGLATALAGRLVELQRPAVIYTGYSTKDIDGLPIIEKPASPAVVVKAMQELLMGAPVGAPPQRTVQFH